MDDETRERQLIATFIDLADTLVADYDVIDLLHLLVERCARILGASQAGILLRGDRGTLEVAAATSERTRLVSLLQLDAAQGPCVDAVATGRPVSVDDIAAVYARWPAFAVEAGELGFQSVLAVPLRLRDEVIGSLNLFSDRSGPMSDDDAAAARGLADIATIGILHARALHESHVVRDQLQHALSSRVLIEQAKGIVSQTDDVDLDGAFRLLRDRARTSGRLLSDVAREVVVSAT